MACRYLGDRSDVGDLEGRHEQRVDHASLNEKGSHASSYDDSGNNIEEDASVRMKQFATNDRPKVTRTSEDMRRTTSNVLSEVASRITTRTWTEPPPPPDGGVKAWTQVGMGWLLVFITWGYVNSFGAFQTYYTSTMLPDQSPSSISWIGSIQIWFTLIIGAFSGRLLDAGLFLPTIFVGAVLQVLGIFLMSISTQYWHLMLTQGVLTGIGGGIFFTPAIALVATYFSSHRAIAVGLTTTGNSAGGIIYPVVVRELIPKIGFAWTTRVLAFINLSFLVVALAFMRPRLPPRRSGPVIDVSAFKEVVYVAVVFGIFFLMWANYYTFYYIASFGTEALGLPFSSSSILVIIINGSGLPFRLIPPLIADRIGPINVLVPVTAVWVLIAWSWLAVDNIPGYYVFTVFYGIVSGAFQCLMPTTIASITKRLDMVGTRLGMAFSIISFAALTGPPIGGALQSTSGGSFVGAQAWAASGTLVGLVLLVVARVDRTGWNLGIKC